MGTIMPDLGMDVKGSGVVAMQPRVVLRRGPVERTASINAFVADPWICRSARRGRPESTGQAQESRPQQGPAHCGPEGGRHDLTDLKMDTRGVHREPDQRTTSALNDHGGLDRKGDGRRRAMRRRLIAEGIAPSLHVENHQPKGTRRGRRAWSDVLAGLFVGRDNG